MAPSSASRSPFSPTVTAPTGTTSTRPASWPEPPDLLDDAGGVGDRVGVRHRVQDEVGEPAVRRSRDPWWPPAR